MSCGKRDFKKERGKEKHRQLGDERVSVSWFGVSLCLLLPALCALLSLCHTKENWLESEAISSHTGSCNAEATNPLSLLRNLH